MANKYFTPSGEPADLSRARAVVLRAEFASIEQAFLQVQADTGRALTFPEGEVVELDLTPEARAHGVFAFDAQGGLRIIGASDDTGRKGQILGWDPVSGALRYWDYASTITSPVNAAANSAAAAAISEANAASSAAAAATSETNAANSAAQASSHASSAATSASTATTKADEAAVSASNASDAAQIANTKAQEASASADSAATSEQNAATSAAQAVSALTDFKGRYLGVQQSAPVTDLNGAPVDEGDLYFDSSTQELRIYTAGEWRAVSAVDREFQLSTLQMLASLVTIVLTPKLGG